MCNERDILGMQLIKRNDELSQLYEKIKVQQTTLNAGERAYAERVADIGALQMDLTTLRSEQHMLKASCLPPLPSLRTPLPNTRPSRLHLPAQPAPSSPPPSRARRAWPTWTCCGTRGCSSSASCCRSGPRCARSPRSSRRR